MLPPDELHLPAARLLLRDFRAEDLADVHAMRSDPEVARFVMDLTPRVRAAIAALARRDHLLQPAAPPRSLQPRDRPPGRPARHRLDRHRPLGALPGRRRTWLRLPAEPCLLEPGLRHRSRANTPRPRLHRARRSPQLGLLHRRESRLGARPPESWPALRAHLRADRSAAVAAACHRHLRGIRHHQRGMARNHRRTLATHRKVTRQRGMLRQPLCWPGSDAHPKP